MEGRPNGAHHPKEHGVVLVIEDDPDVAETLSGLLARFGYPSRLERDGHQALKALRSGIDVRVIVLDLMMPNMDGHSFRREQLADPRFASIPTVVITADPRVTMESLGVRACFRKPFDVEALLAEIGRCF
jgi:CheY-like chemotaxis protein